jgi:methylmalonyl-CoA/ethylmalonyl-CoA epimerase
MIKKIDHIGVAVADLEQQIKFYTEIYGLTCTAVEEVPDQKVKVAIFPVGDVRIELLQPTSPDSPIAKFLEKKGEGIHHIAYLVDDLAGGLQQLQEQGVQLIDKQPRIGAGGHQIAFVHPKSTSGVLTELCEHYS